MGSEVLLKDFVSVLNRIIYLGMWFKMRKTSWFSVCVLASLMRRERVLEAKFKGEAQLEDMLNFPTSSGSKFDDFPAKYFSLMVSSRKNVVSMNGIFSVSSVLSLSLSNFIIYNELHLH